MPTPTLQPTADPPGLRSRQLIWWVIRYALPHWRTFLLVFVFTAIYSGANATRLLMVGLVIDGVVKPVEFSGRESKSVEFYRRFIEPLLPSGARLRELKRESFTSAEVDGGEIVNQEHFGTTLWQIEFKGPGEFRWSGGGKLHTVSYSELTLSAAAPPALQPPRGWTIPGGGTAKIVPAGESPTSVFPILVALALLTALLAIVIAIASFVKGYFTQIVIVRTAAAIRTHVFRHLSGLSLDYFGTRRRGDLISRLTNDVVTLQFSLRYLFGEFVQHPVTIVVFLGVACWASWQLALCVLPFMPILVVPLLRSGRRVKKHGGRSLSKLGEVTETMSQLLSGIRVVKAFRIEEAQWREFDQKNDAFVRSQLKMNRAKATARSAVEGSYNIIAAVVVMFGGWLLLSGVFDLTLGTFGIFLGAIWSLYSPFKSLARATNSIFESLSGAARVFEILEARPTIENREDARPLPRFRDRLAFERVSFRYGPEEPWVVRDVGFVVNHGETVALVGRSGAGKSTLLDLLARFYDPTQGRILLDGVDLRECTHASLLAQVAYVGQDPFLFNTSIEENIRLGRLTASFGDIESAARAAAVHDEIVALPGGYSTVIGERGLNLSGGQRQRLTIARAILKNPEILLLDEATSSLDTESEREVQAALEKLREGRTTVVIAHRLSTIHHADRILVLDAGQIVESGSHEELRDAGGLYAHLQRLQTRDGEETGTVIPRRAAPKS